MTIYKPGLMSVAWEKQRLKPWALSQYHRVTCYSNTGEEILEDDPQFK